MRISNGGAYLGDSRLDGLRLASVWPEEESLGMISQEKNKYQWFS